MNSSIWSEEQTLKFYNDVLESCGPNETDFFCVAARKKYMSESEKESAKLGNTCMIQKTILKEHNESKFLSKLHQADSCMDWFTDREGNYIPRDCMAIYININHTNVLKAIKEFKHQLVDFDYDISSLTQFSNDNKQSVIGKQIKSIQNDLLKSFQDPKNTHKKWIDIDCDTDDQIDLNHLKGLLIGVFKQNAVDPDIHIIKTHGGYHVLIKTSDISAYNKSKRDILTPNGIVDILKTYFGENKEIIINQNMSVPLPGTVQGGFKVVMI